MTLEVCLKRILFEINTGRRIKVVIAASYPTTNTKRMLKAVLWRQKNAIVHVSQSQRSTTFFLMNKELNIIRKAQWKRISDSTIIAQFGCFCTPLFSREYEMM